MQIILFEGTRETAKKSGVAVLEGGKIVDLMEKPLDPASNNIIAGIYFLTPSVFKIIKELKPSDRGETEITDVQREYLKIGKLTAAKLTKEWLDAGDFDDLLNANLITKNIVDSGKG